LTLTYPELAAQQKNSEDMFRDLENGLVLENGNRIVTFTIKTYQAFVDKVAVLAGPRVAQTLLYQMGNEMGRAGFSYSKEAVRSLRDAWKVFDGVLAYRGWGRCIELREKVHDNSVTFVVTTKGCPLCDDRRSYVPRCDVLRGVATGWLEAFLGKKAKSSIETDCAAVRNQHCIFEISFDNQEEEEAHH